VVSASCSLPPPPSRWAAPSSDLLHKVFSYLGLNDQVAAVNKCWKGVADEYVKGLVSRLKENPDVLPHMLGEERGALRELIRRPVSLNNLIVTSTAQQSNCYSRLQDLASCGILQLQSAPEVHPHELVPFPKDKKAQAYLYGHTRGAESYSGLLLWLELREAVESGRSKRAREILVQVPQLGTSILPTAMRKNDREVCEAILKTKGVAYPNFPLGVSEALMEMSDREWLIDLFVHSELALGGMFRPNITSIIDDLLHHDRLDIVEQFLAHQNWQLDEISTDWFIFPSSEKKDQLALKLCKRLKCFKTREELMGIALNQGRNQLAEEMLKSFPFQGSFEEQLWASKLLSSATVEMMKILIPRVPQQDRQAAFFLGLSKAFVAGDEHSFDELIEMNVVPLTGRQKTKLNMAYRMSTAKVEFEGAMARILDPFPKPVARSYRRINWVDGCLGPLFACCVAYTTLGLALKKGYDVIAG